MTIKAKQVCATPQMIPKLDRKWSRTANDPRCWPQMIKPENEEWHGVCSSGRGFNFQHKQKQVIANHILYGYTEIPRLRVLRIITVKALQNAFVISLCLYITITFHNNSTEAKAKIANEFISSAQSHNILHIKYLLNWRLCFISWPALLVKPWLLQTFHVRFPVLVNHAKWNTFVIDVESQ